MPGHARKGAGKSNTATGFKIMVTTQMSEQTAVVGRLVRFAGLGWPGWVGVFGLVGCCADCFVARVYIFDSVYLCFCCCAHVKVRGAPP